MPIVNVALGPRSYPVIIAAGLLEQAALWREHLPAGKILVVRVWQKPETALLRQLPQGHRVHACDV